MNENINPDVPDDTDGHRITYSDKAPGFSGAPDTDTDTDTDADDTEGHRITYSDKAPGFSGALDTNPNIKS